MTTVISGDGTVIAYSKTGAGPALILVDGAFCSRSFGPSPKLAKHLAGHFTVYTYDRRGRGASGDTAPYAIEREVEDLEALVEAAGGSASVSGVSSGAALGLEAAARVPGITKLAVYEAPFLVDGTKGPVEEFRPDHASTNPKAPPAADFDARVRAALAAGRRGDAVKLFMRESVELPAIVVALMRISPAWRKLKAVVPTLPYDLALVAEHQRGTPLEPARWADVTVPTLVVDGGRSPVWMRNAMRSLASVLPRGSHRTLAGQTHMVKAKVLAPVLIDYFTGGIETDRQGAPGRTQSTV